MWCRFALEAGAASAGRTAASPHIQSVLVRGSEWVPLIIESLAATLFTIPMATGVKGSPDPESIKATISKHQPSGRVLRGVGDLM